MPAEGKQAALVQGLLEVQRIAGRVLDEAGAPLKGIVVATESTELRGLPEADVEEARRHIERVHSLGMAFNWAITMGGFLLLIYVATSVTPVLLWIIDMILKILDAVANLIPF